ESAGNVPQLEVVNIRSCAKRAGTDRLRSRGICPVERVQRKAVLVQGALGIFSIRGFVGPLKVVVRRLVTSGQGDEQNQQPMPSGFVRSWAQGQGTGATCTQWLSLHCTQFWIGV